MATHTESQIRKAIKPLLTVYGSLNTSEVKEHINEVLPFSEEDKKQSKTRPGETLILQRIRNIVAHQHEQVKIYDEGFIVDKSINPAIFSLLNPITKESLKPQDITNTKKKRRQFVATKIDWEKARDRNNEIGDQGEEFIIDYERYRIFEEYSLDLATATLSVLHLSRKQGDGLGYDIFSIEENGLPRYIEVKTTTGDFTTPFFMSRNEKHFFEKYGESAYIYRVYNFNKETRHGEVIIIKSTDLFEKYSFDPITFMVKPK